MNEKFRGIFTALLTPFDQNGHINEKVLRSAVEYNLKMKIKGFYVCGSTGEAFLLSEQERMTVMATVADQAAGRATLIAHIGCISTDHSVRLAKAAEQLHYDAISSVAPFYYKFSFSEIKKHYFNIVEAVQLPMLVYNFPAFSGVNLSVENISEFLQDDRFIGVKHTSQDYYALEQYKAFFPNKLVYNGYDEMCLAGLAMGADGAIGSTFNFMGDKFVKMQELVRENKLEKARMLQREANTIITALVKCGVMAGEKAIMTSLGLDFGLPREPFQPVTAEQKEEMLKVVLPLISVHP